MPMPPKSPMRLRHGLMLRAGSHRVRLETNSGFELTAGELVFVSGPTGAGKSLLARALAADAPWQHPVRCGLVPQEPATFTDPYTPIADQLRQAGATTAAVPGLLHRLGLPPQRGKTSAAHLSAGQQQRLLVLLQCLGRPDLLIADEPTSALDPVNREALIELLVESLLSGSPRALLIITHDPLLTDIARRAWQKHAPQKAFAHRHFTLQADADGAFTLQPAASASDNSTSDPTPRLWWPCERFLHHLQPSKKNSAARRTALQQRLSRKGLASLREYQRDLPAHFPIGQPLSLDGAYFHGLPYRSPGIDLQTRPLLLRSGECSALLGESGVGKTTLMRLAAELVRRPWRRHFRPLPSIRLVFQNPDSTTLNPSQSLRRLIAGLPPSSNDGLVDRLMQRLGLDAPLLDRDPPTLSGGEKYRCGLLLALLSEPDFLLLDEPFAAVDEKNQEILADLCLDLKRGTLPFYRGGRATGILLITHQTEIAFQLCDRWNLLDRRAGRVYGECVWQGTPLEAQAAHMAGTIPSPYLRRLLEISFAT
jgi:peptide/nickel transport system ATP-binding protein